MKKIFILLTVFFLPLAAFAASSSFVPLTSLPITGALNTNGDLSSLVNNIYKICIGAAALIAVFQIARAGLMYMAAGDSEESISNARKLISNSILGLVLVLSPYIVFGIINPDILNLKIGNLNTLTNIPTSGSQSGVTNPALSQQICKSYSAFQWATLGYNQQCQDVIAAPASGKGTWVTLPDNTCCAGTAPTGATCCGFDSSYSAPATSGLISKYGYSIAYQDTDPNTGKACVAYDDSNSFPTQAACLSEYNKKIAAAKVYAISRSCTDTGAHSLTGPGAATLSKLPTCSN